MEASTASPPSSLRFPGEPPARPWAQPVLLLTAVMMAGLLLVALGDDASRAGHSIGHPLFWCGLVLIVAPTSARLLTPGTTSQEHLALVVVLTLVLYGVKVVHAPAYFLELDELGHWHDVQALSRTGHLFSTNTIVGAYAYYPGLPLVTNALVQVGGLSPFFAGLLVIGAAKFMLAFALFVLIREVTGSSRVAAVACVIYMANDDFVFFSAGWDYESLSLPLVAVVLMLLALPARSRREQITLVVVAAAITGGIVVTHHVSAIAFCLLTIGWTALAVVRRRREEPPDPLVVGLIAVFATLATAAWLYFISGAAVKTELDAVVGGAASSLGALLTSGQTQGKHLFAAPSSTAAVEATWAQLVGYASVAGVIVLLPLACWWTVIRRGRLSALLAIMALAYPVTLLLRLTDSGSETSTRAEEYLFLGVGVVIAELLVLAWMRAGSRWLSWRVAAGAVYITVLFAGGVIVGTSPWERLPGPYLPSAGERSITPQGVRDADWAGRHLPQGSNVASDLTDDLLMTAYGRLNAQTGVVDGLDVETLLSSPSVDNQDKQIIADDDVGYIVIDRRLADATPLTSYAPDGGKTEPLTRQALAKFDSVPGISKVLDSGEIEIYDSQPLTGTNP